MRFKTYCKIRIEIGMLDRNPSKNGKDIQILQLRHAVIMMFSLSHFHGVLCSACPLFSEDQRYRP